MSREVFTGKMTFHTSVCHQHVVVREEGPFWRQKWNAVFDSCKRVRADATILVTDVYDVYIDSKTHAQTLLSTFHRLTSPRNTSLLLSTEDCCWVGHTCTNDEIQRFKAANVSTHRFMQSQFMGGRSEVLRMLAYGLKQKLTDDMHMMYTYITAHPYRVTLDETFGMFGSLAFADSGSVKPSFRCWNGECSASRIRRKCFLRDAFSNRVCVVSDKDASCPFVWHGNGLLSHAFLRKHPTCTRLLTRLK